MNRYPLEEAFNATAWDILSAIERGFRAQVDVKGKLAEYYLHRMLIGLQDGGFLSDVQWQDRDGEPDFLVQADGRPLRIECKNARSKGACRVELQKTPNSKDGLPTRGYRVSEFDVLSVCLFNRTREWRYLFTATKRLARRENMPEYLVVMQPVPLRAEGWWTTSLEEAIRDALAGEP